MAAAIAAMFDHRGEGAIEFVGSSRLDELNTESPLNRYEFRYPSRSEGDPRCNCIEVKRRALARRELMRRVTVILS